jgi:hypothetical protein
LHKTNLISGLHPQNPFFFFACALVVAGWQALKVELWELNQGAQIGLKISGDDDARNQALSRKSFVEQR